MNEKKRLLQFRVSEEEMKHIKMRASEVGIKNISAYIRKMALNGYIFCVDMSDFHELLRLVRSSSDNLNQYTRRANETGSIDLGDIKKMQKSQNEIITFLEKLMERFGKIS